MLSNCPYMSIVGNFKPTFHVNMFDLPNGFFRVFYYVLDVCYDVINLM